VNTLKLIWLTLAALPGNIASAFKQRQNREPGPKEIEAERLDRIRNPSKYRGK
jgi:hypothetical protein